MTARGAPPPIRPKRIWRKVDGVFLLDKPQGLSSNQALQSARRLLSAQKAGHTGTLDPMATGLLPLCFGEATKFSGELLGADKRYTARVRLGISTDTADAEGKVLSDKPVATTVEQLEQVLADFRGSISQIPPMHSALKRDGKPLYVYARAGIELEREPRQVRIIELRLLDIELPSFEIDVLCSKGTYIRTLASDIGERLGCGAHLTALRRTAIGSLTIGQAMSLETLEGTDEQVRPALLMPPDGLLTGLPEVRLTPDESRRMGHGQALQWESPLTGRIRMYSDTGAFLGVGQAGTDVGLRPERLIVTS